jgi:hypothetical protein
MLLDIADCTQKYMRPLSSSCSVYRSAPVRRFCAHTGGPSADARSLANAGCSTHSCSADANACSNPDTWSADSGFGDRSFNTASGYARACAIHHCACRWRGQYEA